MNGELLPIWSRTWQEVWLRLSKSPMAPEDLFMELVGGLAPEPQQPPSPPQPPAEAFDMNGALIDPDALRARGEYEKALASYSEYRNKYETALNSELQARAFFRKLLNEIDSEAKAINFLEAAYEVLEPYGDDGLMDRFRKLVNDFIVGFSLRYELRGQFSLHATIPGVFSKLISEVKRVAGADAHLNGLLSEFEEAFADLKTNRTQARMKTCFQKQFNLLEGLGSEMPGCDGNDAWSDMQSIGLASCIRQGGWEETIRLRVNLPRCATLGRRE
jgi:hypothetical protein